MLICTHYNIVYWFHNEIRIIKAVWKRWLMSSLYKYLTVKAMSAPDYRQICTLTKHVIARSQCIYCINSSTVEQNLKFSCGNLFVLLSWTTLIPVLRTSRTRRTIVNEHRGLSSELIHCSSCSITIACAPPAWRKSNLSRNHGNEEVFHPHPRYTNNSIVCFKTYYLLKNRIFCCMSFLQFSQFQNVPWS